jgi:isocitrate/isopropylmalate dehydrogenase
MMLEYVGYPEASRAVELAVREAILAEETTRDLGGTLSTPEAGTAILRRIEKASSSEFRASS